MAAGPKTKIKKTANAKLAKRKQCRPSKQKNKADKEPSALSASAARKSKAKQGKDGIGGESG